MRSQFAFNLPKRIFFSEVRQCLQMNPRPTNHLTYLNNLPWCNGSPCKFNFFEDIFFILMKIYMVWYFQSQFGAGFQFDPPSFRPPLQMQLWVLVFLCRSSHQRGFINGANFLKIHRNTPVSDSFVIKLQAFRRIEHILKNICVRLLLTMVSNICQISVVFAKYFPSFDLIFPP